MVFCSLYILIFFEFMYAYILGGGLVCTVYFPFYFISQNSKGLKSCATESQSVDMIF